MPPPDPWDSLGEELDRWQSAGRAARLWLRDDDCVEPTPALDRLTDLTGRFGVPVLLAVIPLHATQALARRLESASHVLPCQHGFAHRNHARPGEKAAELGSQRPVELVVAELGEGRRRVLDLFGKDLCPALVPPWNRIAREILPHLPGLGLDALSTFGWDMAGPVAGLREANCHVDIIDWKGTRLARPPARLVRDLVEALAAARQRPEAPVGVLTHHLVHDDAAWQFLEALFRFTAGHRGAGWIAFDGR